MVIAVLLLGLSSISALAQDAPAAEYLVIMPLVGLESRTEERPGVRQTDWLPPGASADNATRMVTIERISGAAGAEAPMRFIGGLMTCLRSCPADSAGPIDQTPLDGHPAAHTTIDLPARPATGRPGRAYTLAVSGDRDLHVVVVVIRGPQSPAQVDFASGVLRSAVLCTPSSRAAACRPR